MRERSFGDSHRDLLLSILAAAEVQVAWAVCETKGAPSAHSLLLHRSQGSAPLARRIVKGRQASRVWVLVLLVLLHRVEDSKGLLRERVLIGFHRKGSARRRTVLVVIASPVPTISVTCKNEGPFGFK